MPDRFQHGFVDSVVEKLHVFGAFFEHVAEDALQQPFGQFHIAPQIAKRDLRLDHPELGEVPGRVAVLGAEGRPEGVRLAQPARERLGFELPADGQIRRPIEEIEREIDSLSLRGRLFWALALFRHVVQVERGHLEHRAGAFAIAGGDQRRVDVEETAFLEELVDRVAHAIPHPGDGAERVRARPQMGDRPQELERVALLLQRIRGHVGHAVDRDRGGLDFGRLALARRRLDQPGDADAATGREPLDFRFVVRQAGFGKYLDVAEAGAVVDFKETEPGLRVAPRADPTLQDHFASNGVGQTSGGNGEFFGHGGKGSGARDQGQRLAAASTRRLTRGGQFTAHFLPLFPRL